MARFAFSFILLAIVFAWEGYRVRRGLAAGPEWKAYALFAAAALCFGLGLRGLRERHRGFYDTGAAGRPEARDLRD
jgi:hypothetical protein